MGFWENKKVLVTGANGFVGKNLVKKLKEIGVTNLLTPSKNELDLTNEASVDFYMKINKPNIVLHLAGKVGGIGINKEKPGEFYYENTMMGLLITHYAYKYGAERLVSIAAGCGYPIGLEVPYTEDDFWKGLPDENSLGYSMGKKNLILQSWTYRKQFGFNSSVLLPANLYGPHDNFNLDTSHVVPALIRKFIEAKKNGSKKVTVWGSGIASREFLYVEDTVQAIIDVAEHYNESGPLNLGTGTETTIKELVETIKELVEFDGEIIWDSSKPDGQIRRYYDMSKFKNALGYIPSTDIREGLITTIEWFKNEY